MTSLRSLGAVLLVVSSAVLAGGCAAGDDAEPTAVGERGEKILIDIDRLDPCLLMNCRPSMHCEADREEARCVPDAAEGLCPGAGERNLRTGQCVCEQKGVCGEGMAFNDDPSVCACQPRRAECATDDDCLLFSDYCGICSCRALAVTEPAPTCEGSMVQCLVEPCINKEAVCSEGRCVAAAVPQGEPCGPSICAPGMVCCNESCGICTPPGGVCTKQICLDQ